MNRCATRPFWLYFAVYNSTRGRIRIQEQKHAPIESSIKIVLKLLDIFALKCNFDQFFRILTSLKRHMLSIILFRYRGCIEYESTRKRFREYHKISIVLAVVLSNAARRIPSEGCVRGIALRIGRVSRSRPWSGLTSFRNFLFRLRFVRIIFVALLPRVRLPIIKYIDRERTAFLRLIRNGEIGLASVVMKAKKSLRQCSYAGSLHKNTSRCERINLIYTYIESYNSSTHG